MSKSTKGSLARALWDAKTRGDVDRVVQSVHEVFGPVSWRPLGDVKNNKGIVRINSEPTNSLVERLTNAMDAVLEFGHLQHPAEMPSSPRDAARRWCEVPEGGVAMMDDAERRALGNKVRLTLEDSGVPKKPSIVVQDEGTGLTSAAMPLTILSLHGENKIDAPWTMGTYGQGGSTANGFSYATVILSRRQPALLQGDETDEIGWTIVKRIEADGQRYKQSFYAYLVLPRTNKPPAFAPNDLPDLQPGTRITHVEYDLPGWYHQFTTGTGLYTFLNAALFNPVLPFKISSNRSEKESGYGGRTITGVVGRLQSLSLNKGRGDTYIAHQQRFEIPLGDADGAVGLNYWVLRRPVESKSKSGATDYYSPPDSAVSMTLFGQRQNSEHRRWIKEKLSLPFLTANLIVEIEGDRLTTSAKDEVFTSTRERATRSELLDRIYTDVIKIMTDDDELAALEREEKERRLARSVTATNEKIRKRLSKYIKTKLKDITRPTPEGRTGGGPGDHGTARPSTRPRGPRMPRNTDDSMLPQVPTILSFTRAEVEIPQSGRRQVTVEINAKNGYLPLHDAELTLSWDRDPGPPLRIARSPLLGGTARWYFMADADAELGDYFLTAELHTAQAVLSDKLRVTVVRPPEPKSNDQGSGPEDQEIGPEVCWVNRDDWDVHEFDETTVGLVAEDADGTTIFVNRHHRYVVRAIDQKRNLSGDAIDRRAARYQYPIACQLWFQHAATKDLPFDQRPEDSYIQQELERLAEAVLMASDEDFDADND